MPKLGMEPLRRAALVEATIAEIGQTGTLDVTVGAISKRAGMSSALAHHYFGGKDQIFLAAMRHILRIFGQDVVRRLNAAKTPLARLEAIVDASFAPENFAPQTISAWLNFYVLAQSDPQVKRLLQVYQRRLHSNLTHALRPLVQDPETIAEAAAAMLDGLYIRASLGDLRRAPNAILRDFLAEKLRTAS